MYEEATLHGSQSTLSLNDELFTLLVEIESVLNSRLLVPLDSGPEDGMEVLIPGHFLVGKALKSIPTIVPIHRNINVL